MVVRVGVTGTVKESCVKKTQHVGKALRYVSIYDKKVGFKRRPIANDEVNLETCKHFARPQTRYRFFRESRNRKYYIIVYFGR